MRFMSTIKKRADEGFTLVEILIIAPIVILVISGFIALMITMVGDVLAIRDRNNMAFEIRNTLDRIEQDTRLSTQFLTTSNTLLSPQGSDNNFTGTAAFSNSNSLILGTLTTDKNPTDPTRQLIFYAKQPNECGPQQNYNRPFIGKTIYFIKNNSLWRRSYLFPWNLTSPANDETLCTAPWQQNSCSPGYTGTRCQTNDVEMMQNVSSFSVKYYATPQSTTEVGAANALSAASIEVSINGQKTIAGRSVTNAGKVRVAKINNIDADLATPTTPTVTAQAGSSSITFSWPSVLSATSYLIRYNTNGGSWTETTNDSLTTTFSVPAWRNDTVTIQVAAKNSTGTSAYDEEAGTIPAWNICDLQNGWQDYGSGYATAGYTKTSAHVVVLKGLVRNGTATVNTPICTLPTGFWPSKRLIFITSSQNGAVSGTGRIDIATNGEVRFTGGTNGWISLDGLRFVASTASYTWGAAGLQNGWTEYTGAPNDTYPHESTLDNQGRVHMRGVVVPGTTTAGTTIYNIPAGQTRSTQFTYLPEAGANGFNWNGFGGIVDARLAPGAWLSQQAMFYPGAATGWSDLTPYLANGWTWINVANHATLEFRKSADGIVTVKGLAKNAATHDGTTIATLPAGYRPKEQLLTSCVAFGGYCRVDIMPDGRIIDNASASNGWLSLDNISFMAEQ